MTCIIFWPKYICMGYCLVTLCVTPWTWNKAIKLWTHLLYAYFFLSALEFFYLSNFPTLSSTHHISIFLHLTERTNLYYPSFCSMQTSDKVLHGVYLITWVSSPKWYWPIRLDNASWYGPRDFLVQLPFPFYTCFSPSGNDVFDSTWICT